MNKLLKPPLELPLSRGMNLILTEARVCNAITELIAALLLRGPLFVIAGGDWLPASELTHILCGNTLEVKQVLNRLYTAHASTCHELFDSLASRRSNGEAILVLDMLHTFYDSDIPLSMRLLRLNQCCRELQRLAFYRPVTVVTMSTYVENRDNFISLITSVADNIYSLSPEYEPVKQPALF